MLTQSVQGNKYITLTVEEPSGMYYAYYTKTKTGQNTILKQHYEKEIKPRLLTMKLYTSILDTLKHAEISEQRRSHHFHTDTSRMEELREV